MKRKKQSNAIIKGIVMIVIIMVIFLTLPINNVQGLNWLFNESVENELSEDDLQKIVDVYNSIQLYYIDDVDKEALLEGALKGMVDAIDDPYSEYLNVQQSESMDESFEGSFSGIGVQFYQSNGNVTVISAINGTPAADAGIQPNDIILQADGVELTGMDTNEVVELIRGEIGTTVELVILRNSTEITLEIERAEIPIISVEGEMDANNSNVGIIKLTQFNGTTYDELVEVITDLREQGATAFVLDLRNNPGGLLDQAIRISNMFLEDDQIIMQMEEKNEYASVYQADDKKYGEFQVDEPFVVLVNQGSASASEIVAGAIKDNEIAPIVGETTFGKGSVQSIFNETDFGELKMTFARWLLPSGEWIHGEGIQPDVEIIPEPIHNALLLDSEETLSVGTRSDYVYSLTSILNSLAYDVEIDDTYTEAVRDSVIEFQKDHDLEPTGEVNGDTAILLNDLAREYVNEHDKQLDEVVDYLLEYMSEEQLAA